MKVKFNNEFIMRKSNRPNNFLKKFVFFYLIFNITAYSAFLVNFRPVIKSQKEYTYYSKDYKSNIYASTGTFNYILTPGNDHLRGINISGNVLTDGCNDCSFMESEYFYPFHKFNFEFENDVDQDYWTLNYTKYTTKIFIGIFGFYDHTEFFFYVILPFLIFVLSIVYKRFIK